MIFLYFLPLVIAVLLAVFVLIPKGIITIRTRSSSLNESKYLKIHDSCIPAASFTENIQFAHPFNLKIEAMDKLILFDIENDPVYTTLELQEFNDDTSKGLIILMYRTDKEIDVYYTSEIAHDFYKGSPKGIVMEFTPQEYCFDKSDTDIRFLIRFQDKDGSEIFIKADEHNPGKEHFSILAPAGDMIDNFTSFPLFYMKETAFFEKEHSQIQIRIGTQDREPVFIPIAINGKFVYLSRYCFEPVVASLNENYSGVLLQNDPMDNNSMQYYVSEDAGKAALHAIEARGYNHKVALKLHPPFPDLRSIEEGLSLKGRFSTSVDNTDGILGGEYSLKKTKGRVFISLNPKIGWQPDPGRKWYKQYRWESSVTVREKQVHAESKWVKK